MFPPEAPPPAWDAKGAYHADKLAVYASTARGRLLKVGKKMTLLDVCKAAAAKEGAPHDGLELKNGCASFVVLPRGDAERKWVDEFKARRA